MNHNGNGQAQEVNPIEAAQLALMFLARADHKISERANFDKAAALLQAIGSGRYMLTAAPTPPSEDVQPVRADA